MEQTAEQVVKTSIYGKFDSLDKLLEGYKALEAEFTRRSQRVKELESKLNDLSAHAQSEGVSAEQISAMMHTEDFIKNYILDDVEICAAVVENYLRGLDNMNATRTLGGRGGYTLLTPVAKPHTLLEAKRLAEKIVKA